MSEKIVLILLVGFGLAAGSAVAGDVDLSKLPPPAKVKGVTYEKDIKPLLEASCLKCHGPERPKSKYRVDSREAIIKGGSSGEPAIIPGQSAKSPLVQFVSDLVEEMEMPPVDMRDKYPPLTKEQVALIRAWVDEGAK